jgi:hypothetical protein
MNIAKIGLALLFAPAGAGMFCLSGCGSEPSTPLEQKQLVNDSAATLKDLEMADSTLADKVKSAAGYVMFPTGLNHLKKRRAPHLRPSRLSDIPQSVREASRLNTSQFHFGASHGSCGYQSGSVHVFCCF